MHTRKQDIVWFYTTIFLAPALVIGLGLMINRRRRVGASRGGPVARPPADTGAGAAAAGGQS